MSAWSPRRQHLLDYFRMVAQDLVTRGALSRQSGQTLDDVLRSQPRIVLGEVQADFIAVGQALGAGLAAGFGVMIENGMGGPVGALAGAAGMAIGRLISELGKKK